MTKSHPNGVDVQQEEIAMNRITKLTMVSGILVGILGTELPWQPPHFRLYQKWLRAVLLAAKSFAAPMGTHGPAGLPQAKALPQTTHALKVNMAVLQSAHSMGVPAILYEHKNGSTGLIPGMVSHGELLTMLPNLK